MTSQLQTLLRILLHTIQDDPAAALREGQTIAAVLTPAILLARLPQSTVPIVVYARAHPQETIDVLRAEIALLAAHEAFYEALAASLPRA